MAASTKRQAKEQARSAINKWALGFAGVAWIPGSHYVMTGGDVTYGVDLDKTTTGAVFATIAAPLIGSKID
jgi:hypothetical protein